tara:strand:+ start:143 stop:319 length:177 start_codon:yes stop_codon:yes gene_type:complete
MSFDESEQLRIKQFQKEITEISDRFGITEDAAFPRWICENFWKRSNCRSIEKVFGIIN